MEMAITNIRTELSLRLAEYAKKGRILESQRLEQRTQFDLEMMEEIGRCKGIEGIHDTCLDDKLGSRRPRSWSTFQRIGCWLSMSPMLRCHRSEECIEETEPEKRPWSNMGSGSIRAR